MVMLFNSQGQGHMVMLFNSQGQGLMVMLFNITFNNISVTSWQSVLLVEETRVPGESN